RLLVPRQPPRLGSSAGRGARHCRAQSRRWRAGAARCAGRAGQDRARQARGPRHGVQCAGAGAVSRGAEQERLLRRMDGQVLFRRRVAAGKIFRQAWMNAAVGTVALDAPAGRSWARRIDAVLGPLVELPAAVLVLADILVLLAGVVARFVFNRPLVWSD